MDGFAKALKLKYINAIENIQKSCKQFCLQIQWKSHSLYVNNWLGSLKFSIVLVGAKSICKIVHIIRIIVAKTCCAIQRAP